MVTTNILGSPPNSTWGSYMLDHKRSLMWVLFFAPVTIVNMCTRLTGFVSSIVSISWHADFYAAATTVRLLQRCPRMLGPPQCKERNEHCMGALTALKLRILWSASLSLTEDAHSDVIGTDLYFSFWWTLQGMRSGKTLTLARSYLLLERRAFNVSRAVGQGEMVFSGYLQFALLVISTLIASDQLHIFMSAIKGMP